MCVRKLSVLVLWCLALPVFAAEEEEEKPDPLSGNIKFGFLSTTGNTDTTSLNSSADASYKTGRWQHDAHLAALEASENEQTTAESYELRWTSGWDLTDKDFLFGRLNWRKDRFGGFDTQFSQTLGYGRKVVATDVHKLDLALGAGARQSEAQNGVREDETILTGGLDYKWQFSETAEFTQTLAVEVGDNNTFSESVTAVKTTLIGAFGLVLSYTVRNNSDVPAGTEKTDTRTSIALQYDF